MNASKQRPEGTGGATPTAAAASSRSSSSALSSLSSAPPIAGLSSSDAAEIADLQKRGQWVSAVELLGSLIDADSDASSSAVARSSRTSSIRSLLLIRAQCYFRLNEYNAALGDCNSVLKSKSRDMEANSLRFECLLGLRRYNEAANAIGILSKRDKANGTQHYKPLAELWSRIQLEREGTFDVAAMMDEAVSLVTPFSETGDDDSDDGDDDDGDDDGSSDCDLSELYQQMARPCVRLGPHADYLHPSVECAVAIAGKGRGTRVRASLSPFADSSAASSSSSSSSAASSTASGSLPNHSLVMSMKAISVGLRSDDRVRPDMLIRKLKDQPHLMEQVRRLFGDPAREAERTTLLLKAGAEATWKAPAAASSAASSTTVDRLHLSLTATLQKNPFSDSLSDVWKSHGVGGSGLFFLPSFFNHSCVPNCHWTLIGDQIFIRTARDVVGGEELTIAYRDVMGSSFRVRQETLRSTWSFDCACEFCAPYALHPKLAKHESNSRSKRSALSTEFYALPSSALTQRIAVADSLDGLIAAHAQLVSKLPGLDRSLLKVSMLEHRLRLSLLLSQLLRVMPPTDARFSALLQRHRQACEQHALTSIRWDCYIDGMTVRVLDQLRMQVKFPAHATMTIAQQQAAMRKLIRRFAAYHGLPCGLHFLTQHKDDLNNAKLRPLYDKCLVQIRAEEAAAELDD